MLHVLFGNTDGLVSKQQIRFSIFSFIFYSLVRVPFPVPSSVPHSLELSFITCWEDSAFRVCVRVWVAEVMVFFEIFFMDIRSDIRWMLVSFFRIRYTWMDSMTRESNDWRRLRVQCGVPVHLRRDLIIRKWINAYHNLRTQLHFKTSHANDERRQ